MRLEGRLWKDDQHWLIEVPALSALTQGRSREEAYEMIADLIENLADKPGLEVRVHPRDLGRWQVVELRTFISHCVEREIPVIPVLLPEAEEIPEELVFLNEFTWVKLSKNIEDAEALDNLEWGITGEHPRRRRG